MNARTVVAGLVAAALATPAGATARVVPAKHPAHPAKRIVKHAAAPRVLCICVTGAPTLPAESEAQLEADIDQDMIAHGLDPVYGTTTTTADASPTRSG